MSRSTAPTFLIVDGNNIIHAWPDLLVLHRKRRGLGHQELRRRLRDYHDLCDYRLVVVFDGKSGPQEEERDPSGFQVIYTDGASTADGVIERLTAKYAKKFRIIVATNDLAEQNVVASFGAETWSAELLRATIDRSEGRWRDYLK
ncbi:MAG: NYN domain-containing protein [Verrucomicrobiae bacterium]|nr:NYN domain-containing protein [Verrucomicrobiae bacterium]